MNNMDNMKRREFLKKAAYIPPAIITLSALPSIAQSGSRYNGGITGTSVHRSGTKSGYHHYPKPRRW